LATSKIAQMKSKWLFLTLVTAILTGVYFLLGRKWDFHESFLTIVFFFAAQTFVIFRIESWTPEKYAVQVSLIKIVLRFLSSLAFITILIITNENLYLLVIQFIIIYLIYMVFEIGTALTNLRRN